MDDILRRLSVVETSVAEIRADVSAIKAILPHLASKADVADMKADIAAVRGDIHALETRIIKWIIGTVMTSAALAFAIAKFVS